MLRFRVQRAAAGLGLVVCLALAGCDRAVDLTAKPTEAPDQQVAESAPAAVSVSAPLDLSKTEELLVRLLPGDIASIARRLHAAACTTINGRQVCLDARVSGRIIRDGQARLGGNGHGLELRVPLRYDLVAQPVGPGAAVAVSGKLMVVAHFSMTMDERWQPTLKLDPVLTWPDSAKIKVFDGETAVQSDVETVLTARLQKMPATIIAGLIPTDLRPDVELAWRYLHYPLPLSQDQQIWLRGTPLGLHFGGIKTTNGLPELRVIITARLQTFIGDRPAPLPPSPLPQLGSGIEASGGGIILPADITYEALSADAAHHLPAVAPAANSTTGADTNKATVRSVSFFPASKRLGLGVHLSLPASGSWLPGHGVAYFLATPDMRPGSAQLVLTNCDLYAANGKSPARQKDYAFLSNLRFAESVGQSVSLDIADKLNAATEIIKHAASLPLAKGLRLWLQPGDPKVVKITAGIDALRLQIESGGEFIVRKEGTDVASGADAAKITP